MEDSYLINERKLNKLSPRIVLSSLHGPAADYFKKLFANFGFSNLTATESQSTATFDFSTVPIPSTALWKEALKQSIYYAEQRDSKFILCTDPIGECLLIAERLEDETWHIFEAHELAIILIPHLIAFKKLKGKEEQKYYVYIERENEILKRYCQTYEG